MSTRQYIGARYVPTFYTNPYGGNDWKPNTQYEALTIVTDGINSYTSRKPVPSNIGRPSENPEYWVSTGIYNSQVEEYRQEVEKLNKTVAEIETRKAIFIGDSFMVTGVQNQLAKYFKITTPYYYGNTGAGYVRTNPSGEPHGNYNFEGLIEKAYNEIGEDANNIDYIFIYGGINDSDSSISVNDVSTRSLATFNKAITRFPNAKIVVACNSGKSAISVEYDKKITNILANAVSVGCIALPGVEHCLYNMSNLVDTDNVHPNSGGCGVIAQCIYNYLNGCDSLNRKYYYKVNGNYTGTIVVKVNREDVVITYDLTCAVADASVGITLDERCVPGYSVGGSCGNNQSPLPFITINAGGVVYLFGTVNVGANYTGSVTYPIGVNNQ